jgi:hypothetical protein
LTLMICWLNTLLWYGNRNNPYFYLDRTSPKLGQASPFIGVRLKWRPFGEASIG